MSGIDMNGDAGLHDYTGGALILAAGGVLEKPSEQGPLIALVYRDRYGGQWGLPKGKQDQGESLQQTALREVKEETGCDAKFTGFAGCSHYYHGPLPKVVLYWKLALQGRGDFAPSSEVEKMEWFSPAKAIELLAHEDEKRIVRKVYGL